MSIAITFGGLGILKLTGLALVLLRGSDQFATVWFIKQVVYALTLLAIALPLWRCGRNSTGEPSCRPDAGPHDRRDTTSHSS